MSSHKIIKKLGSGGFSTVYLAQKDEKFFAVKSINPPKNDRERKFIEEEKSITLSLKHPNIVKGYSSFTKNQKTYILLEYIEGVDLFEYMKDKSGEELGKKVAHAILSAVAYSHSIKICHGDIKPENVLVKIINNEPQFKLIDWGLSLRYNDNPFREDPVGTIQYADPASLEDEKFDCEKADIWQIGIMIYECIFKKVPYELLNETDEEFDKLREKIKEHTKLEFPFEISKEAQEFLHALTERNPTKRVTAKEALKMAWLA